MIVEHAGHVTTSTMVLRTAWTPGRIVRFPSRFRFSVQDGSSGASPAVGFSITQTTSEGDPPMATDVNPGHLENKSGQSHMDADESSARALDGAQMTLILI